MHHRLSSLNRARYAIKRGTSSVHQRRVYIYSYSTLSIDAVHDSYIVGRTYTLDTFPFFPLLSHSFSHKYTAATNIVRRSALDIIYLFFLSFFSSFFCCPFSLLRFFLLCHHRRAQDFMTSTAIATITAVNGAVYRRIL
jgi:isocitrate dehydrogenase kinase/phosphatase